MTEQPLFAFVLMPFKPEFDDIYKLGIKEAAARASVIAERLDEQIFIDGMLERIYRQIEAADIIIADMSGQSSNVFYEVGYAHAKGKLCILLTKDAQDIPFDLKHRRHIEYKNSITYLREELTKNLLWAKIEIEDIKKSGLRVEFKELAGDLKKTDFYADATVHFKVNIFSNSKQPVEIHTVYFYTGNRWSIRQGSSECPTTDSDVDSYNYRYFLNPPVARLPKDSWAQLQFNASRRIANKFLGDSIENSYRIAGRFMLRFVTSDGSFDHQHNADVEVMDIPF